MEALHERLLRIGFDAGGELGLVLAGGYALAAHELIDRPSQDIDFATGAALPMSEILEKLAAAYRRESFTVEIIEGTPRMARMVVRNASVVCEVDVLKEAIGPPCHLRIGPVLSLDDAVGLKMRALHERAAHRDFIDVNAANARLSWPEMERWGARHTAGFSLAELADRLGSIEERDDRGFASYGLADARIIELRRWAAEWESDIRARLAAGEPGPAGAAEDEWDAYLDE
jgi:predicted nucleotidyltransferase component of viral defense system